jgi:phage terminase large subunit-like protein
MTYIDPSKCRKEYNAGLWAYARGRPAPQHPRYRESLKYAKGFDSRWIHTWSDVDAVLAGCAMRVEKPAKVCEFFENVLHHTKGGIVATDLPGRPVALMDWHRYDLLYPLFGWLRPDGTRRFRKASIWVPKKNAKSFLCSGLGLQLMALDGETSAEVYSAAGSRDQASIIHREAANMVRLSPWLLKECTCVDSTKTISHRATMSRFKALASDAGLQEGLNWSALLFDEVHVQKDRNFFAALQYGGIARRQPLLVEISTAGVYDPLSIGWEEYEYATKVYEGSITDWETLIYIAGGHTAEQKRQWPWVRVSDDDLDDDDFADPAVHLRANPGLGICIAADELASTAERVRNKPLELNDFLRYRLNIWVHAARQLVPPHEWSACATLHDIEALKGRQCYGGLDLSKTNDITSLALWFPPVEQDEPHKCLVWCWLPRENIQDLETESHAPYRQWAEQGYLELTEGTRVDYDYVERRIDELLEVYQITDIGFDPYAATEIVNHMLAKHGENFMVLTRQGMLTMAPGTKWVCDLIAEGKLAHPDNPVLNWHVSNAEPRFDSAGNFMITKGDGKVRHKVDAFTALVCAGVRAMTMPPKLPSVYESRGILSL